MINLSDVLEKYPKKSFRETFDEKVEVLKWMRITKEQICAKRQEFSLIFGYDNNVKGLKDVLSNYDGEIDDLIMLRVVFHFSKISDLNSYLDELEFWNSKDIDSIFQKFSNKIKNYWYYKQLYLYTKLNDNLENPITIRTFIEELIFEVKILINSFYIDLKEIGSINKDIEKIKETCGLIKWAEILDSYAKEFKDRSDDYKNEAEKWKKWLIGSFIGFAIVFWLLIFINLIDVDLIKYLARDLSVGWYLYISVIIIKASIIIAIIQIIRFYYRNYNATKHLYQQSLHKYDVLKSLRGIYNTLDEENKEARDELIKTWAIIAFQNIESGYITTKEWAGNADSGLSIVSSILWKNNK